MRSSTKALASHVLSELNALKLDPTYFPPIREPLPVESMLVDTLDALYFTTLKTEEGRPVLTRLCLVNPQDPDEYSPPYIRPTRWVALPLGLPLKLTTRNLLKIALSADPWSSSLAIFPDVDGDLVVWGLVDQGLHWSRMLVRDGNSLPPPGIIHVVANGVGDISVFNGWQFLGRLRQDTLIRTENLALWEGPLHDRLVALSGPMCKAVAKASPHTAASERDGMCVAYWINALSRILIQIESYRHGGALLVCDDEDQLELNYCISYERLNSALEREIVAHLADGEELERLKLEHRYFRDIEDAVSGAVRFIAALSRVDGLVLMNSALQVRGYGVKIQTASTVPTVRVAESPHFVGNSSERLDPRFYGTRHQSMIRYCHTHPNSVGFVVSQDGDVRGIMKIDDEIVLWDNLQTRWSPGLPVIQGP